MEHTLEFDRELEAAFDLELGKHASFRIIRNRSVMKKALGQMSLIISFEDVLLCDEPEQADRLIKDNLDFGIRFLGDSYEMTRG
jgi:hypothetical protein